MHTRSGIESAPTLGAAPERSQVAFWTQVVTLITAVIPLLSTLIGFALGLIKLSGVPGVFGSRFFWAVYGGFLVALVTCLTDFVILQLMHRRLSRRQYRMTALPKAYNIFCHLVWLALYIPYLFWVGGMIAEMEYPAGPGFLLLILGFPFLFMGGEMFAEMAHEIDLALNPWAYAHFNHSRRGAP